MYICDTGFGLKMIHTGHIDFSGMYWKPEKTAVTYFDSSAPAFAHSVGHGSTRRVDHGHEANEAQVLSGEVHLLGVKSKAFWELVVRQVEMAETWMGHKTRSS